TPIRTPTGRRLYSPRDVATILQLRARETGAAQAAARLRAATPSAATPLIDAYDRADLARAERLIAEACAARGVLPTLRDLLAETATALAAGTTLTDRLGREHLRARLLALLAAYPPDHDAAPTLWGGAEASDVVAIVIAVCAAAQGARVALAGSALSADDADALAETVGAPVVVVAGADRWPATLPSGARVAVPASSAASRGSAGPIALPFDPIEAARIVADAATRPAF
ncbi:MAG: hypothetical protein NZ518_03760, partial [Dehalococcoidia bacterium]|nr:hypothetical protein [Dehalococcoidia bacterium]